MNSTNYNGSLKHYPYAYEKFGVTRGGYRYLPTKTLPYKLGSTSGKKSLEVISLYKPWIVLRADIMPFSF